MLFWHCINVKGQCLKLKLLYLFSLVYRGYGIWFWWKKSLSVSILYGLIPILKNFLGPDGHCNVVHERSVIKSVNK